jgi:hypothetical protein
VIKLLTFCTFSPLTPCFYHLESEIVDKLYAMIRDRDTHVVVNAILALEAILVDEGGIVINQNIATHLIQRYKEWNPSQLQVILGILCRYKPQISDDVYEIMVTRRQSQQGAFYVNRIMEQEKMISTKMSRTEPIVFFVLFLIA